MGFSLCLLCVQNRNPRGGTPWEHGALFKLSRDGSNQGMDKPCQFRMLEELSYQLAVREKGLRSRGGDSACAFP